MKAKLIYLWETIQTSFWFVPLLLVLAAIGSAIGLIFLDSTIDYKPSGAIGYLFSGGAEAARSILSTIAGAMLAVAGTVFSITLVALTLASSQFGPRLLRNFMHDRLNQIVLGAYIATFIYCLLVLRTVKSDNDLDFIPNLSILFAIMVAVANIFLLIIFIHHISLGIQADYVISDSYKILNKNINRLFPDQDEESDSQQLANRAQEMLTIRIVADVVKAHEDGYLQMIDYDRLLELGKTHDLLISIKSLAGDFVVKQQPLATVHARKKTGKKQLDEIRGSIIMGGQRTPLQDVEFAIHQMVEVAARALSPGINDPFTAITCIDKLTATLSHLTRARFPEKYRCDTDGVPRVEVRPVNFAGLIDASFNQIRQYGERSPSVLIRLMESLGTLQAFARADDQREAIQRHAAMVLEAGEAGITVKNDLDDLKTRYESFLKINV
ncbi:MAG: DUF2254 domain-containing protein [Clostridia bacterium]|nr:DUF2254 domain-containing protein [Clostridia bacterium]